MIARPILLSSLMVRATLDNRKGQTRRANGLEFYSKPENKPDEWRCARVRDGVAYFVFGNSPTERAERCQYGQPGDLLWVRETWQHENYPLGPVQHGCQIFYRADYLDDPLGPDLERSTDAMRRRWAPSIHMPRWASRLTLRITDVRVERLQSISEADVDAEGLEPVEMEMRPHFQKLWESINGADSWDLNPWIWVIVFETIKRNVDDVLSQSRAA